MSCNRTLYEIAREAAGPLCEVPSHTLVMLERLVEFFAERQQDWDTFRLEVDHRTLQLQAEEE